MLEVFCFEIKDVVYTAQICACGHEDELSLELERPCNLIALLIGAHIITSDSAPLFIYIYNSFLPCTFRANLTLKGYPVDTWKLITNQVKALERDAALVGAADHTRLLNLKTD